MLQNAKDKILEQKRAEHEHARQEHRRRFEEQMQMLESKQQRDEALLRSIDEVEPRALNQLPVTPIKTPGQMDARSRATTMTKGTPPFKIFESRVTVNEQLVTPPSDQQNKVSPGSFAGLHSVPGSRRTSTSLGFEGLSISEQAEDCYLEGFGTYGTSGDPRRTYIDQIKPKIHADNQRLSMQKVFNDEGKSLAAFNRSIADDTSAVSVPSYLQMNTTDDSFPILVRKDSYAGSMVHNKTSESGVDNRAVSGPNASQPFVHPQHMRNGLESNNQRGLAENFDMHQGKTMPEFSSSGHKGFPGKHIGIFNYVY